MRYGSKPKNDCRVAAGNVQVNHMVLDSMVEANKNRNKKTVVQAIRDKVEESMYDVGIYYEGNNKAPVRQGLTANRTRPVDHGRYIEDSKTITNYSTIKPKTMHTIDVLAVDPYGDESQAGQQRGRRHTKDAANVNTHDYDADQHEKFGLYDKAKKIDATEVKNKGRQSQFGLDSSDLTDEYLMNDL